MRPAPGDRRRAQAVAGLARCPGQRPGRRGGRRFAGGKPARARSRTRAGAGRCHRRLEARRALALIHTAAPALQRHCHAGPVQYGSSRARRRGAARRQALRRAVPRAGRLNSRPEPHALHPATRAVSRAAVPRRPAPVSASTMIRFQQASRAASSRCSTKPTCCSTPATRSASSAPTAPASPACSRCCAACCTPTRATWTTRPPGAWRTWPRKRRRWTARPSSTPSTATPRCASWRPSWPRWKPSRKAPRTACAWPRSTPRWPTPTPTPRTRAPSSC